MHLFLIALLLCCVAQNISAAQHISAVHPNYNSIKFTLMKVGENKISFDDALDKIVPTDLKIKIIKDTYQKDFHNFFFDVRHLYIFTQSVTFDFAIIPGTLTRDADKKNLPLDSQIHSDKNSYILSKIEAKYPALYKEVMEPLEDCKSTLDRYKPTFMCMDGNTAFLANGTDTIIIYDTKKKQSTIFKSQAPEVHISCLAPIQNRDVIKVDTPDIFCSETNSYFIDNTHAEFQVAPILFRTELHSNLNCMTNTDDPSLVCGITENKNGLLLIKFKKQDTINIQNISIPTTMADLKEAIGLGTLGCHIMIRLSDQKVVMVTPYLFEEYLKIHYCDFSSAQAAMLYRVMQDKKNKTIIASAEEHKVVQELIPDAYVKTLQKE
jgi:hypothetical protein